MKPKIMFRDGYWIFRVGHRIGSRYTLRGAVDCVAVLLRYA